MSRTYKNGEIEKYDKGSKYNGGMVTARDKENAIAIKRNRNKRMRLRMKLFLKSPFLISKRINCYHTFRKNGKVQVGVGWV